MYGLHVLHISNSSPSSVLEDSQLLLLFDFDCLVLIDWHLLWGGGWTTWPAHRFIAIVGLEHYRGGPSSEILIKFFTRLTPRAARVSLSMRLSIENDLSSFAVLTDKHNANSATKRIILNLILHFSKLQIRCQVPK